MSFTTLKFVIFFAAAAGGWYLLPRGLRRVWLLAAGIAFYAFSGWKPMLLLAGETGVSYLCALAAGREWLGKKKLWTATGLLFCLGMLALCKYFNLLADTLLPRLAGIRIGAVTGLSFYSFAVSGYLIDVYRGRMEPERNFVDYAAFVLFFPVLLAGPIGRAREFLPQLRALPAFSAEKVQRGGLRFLWGVFKKLVAADTLGLLVDGAYADPSAVSGGAMLLAVLAYSLQIYLDFAAYSDMAVGCAEMLGFRVTENFRAPYLSRTVKSFWKKWHISLTDWFREYLYIPLGGSRGGAARTWRNVLIVFAVSGLWHGSSLTFLVWGLLNGVYQVAGAASAPLREKLRRGRDGAWLAATQGVVTFLLLTGAWIFFRAESMGQAVYVIKHILLIPRDGFGAASAASLLNLRQAILLVPVLALCISEDVRIARGKNRPDPAGRPFRFWLTAAGLVFAVALFGVYGEGFDGREFVYFRF